MNNMNTPGFTAEASCSLVSTTHYQAAVGRYCEAMPAITPQLWRIWKGSDDVPGGWGVPPWIGDLRDRQERVRQKCTTRCKKIVNPEERLDCLDSCY